jgi:chemotaxis response regulator CheB
VTQIPIGKIISNDPARFVASIDSKNICILRQVDKSSEFLVWNKDQTLPSRWSSVDGFWKIIGNEAIIKDFSEFLKRKNKIKTVIVDGDYQVSVDLTQGSISFQGQRIKTVLFISHSVDYEDDLVAYLNQSTTYKTININIQSSDFHVGIFDCYPDLIIFNAGYLTSSQFDVLKIFLKNKNIPVLAIDSCNKNIMFDISHFFMFESFEVVELDFAKQNQADVYFELHTKIDALFNMSLKSVLISKKNIDHQFLQKFTNFNSLIVFGSSTGGTQALQSILKLFPSQIPPILIAQHIPPVFSNSLAERFNKMFSFTVKEAEHGEKIVSNCVFIAPGGKHMTLSNDGKNILISEEPPINRFRPSIDALFFSVAKNCRLPIVAILLTGMGKDGAKGLLEIRNCGGYTIAQDEESSVVFGMPKEAIRLDAVDKVASLHEIPNLILTTINHSLNKK